MKPKSGYTKYWQALVSTYKATAEDYLANPGDYLRTFRIIINGKLRTIVTYQPNTKGRSLRYFHKLFAAFAEKTYVSDKHSYAYKKNYSILKCAKKHLEGRAFVKTDIHAYFDSVDFEILYELLRSKTVGNRRVGAENLNLMLKACFYENRLPIGFISSPVLSDLYLNDFDAEISARFPAWTYTRYADDLIFSSSEESRLTDYEEIRQCLCSLLEKKKLELNEKKTYARELKMPGDAIHFLGLNLVRQAEGKNKITISDKYIRETSKDYCELISNRDSMPEDEYKEEFAKVYGKIAFIRHCSSSSTKKLQKMLAVKLNKDIQNMERETLFRL